MKNESPTFAYFGTFTNEDARLLLDAFIAENIPFSLAEDSPGIKNMDYCTASVGGTFGHGAGVAIFTRPEDEPKISHIYKKVMNFKV